MDKDMKSVAEEDGLRKLLTSDEESEEEKNSSDEEEEKNKKEEEKNKKEEKKEAKDKKKSKPKKSKDGEKKESLTDLSSDSDSDTESKKPRKLIANSANNSRSASPSLDLLAAGPSGLKRKLPTDLGAGGNSNGASENSNSPNVTPAKKTKYEPAVPSSFSGVISGNRE